MCTYLNAVCRCHIGVSLSCLKHCEPIKVLANPVVIIAVAALKLKSCAAAQGRSDGGVYRYIYPQNQSTLQIFMWLKLVVFSLTHAGQIRYRASVRLSSCFFYLLTHHNLYPPPNEIPGYAPAAADSFSACSVPAAAAVSLLLIVGRLL